MECASESNVKCDLSSIDLSNGSKSALVDEYNHTPYYQVEFSSRKIRAGDYAIL